MGAVKVLRGLFPDPGRLQFIYADLGDKKSVSLSSCFENRNILVLNFSFDLYLKHFEEGVAC